jgi:gamma-glutamylcyclotransferase (GGCT)/AIG2-like uncharacterized protein YtfP
LDLAVFLKFFDMYYFAYGTNMSLDQMRRLCGRHFLVLGTATLSDYEFVADLRGFISARPKSQSKLFGVLYEADQHCIDALDDFEGYPDVFNRAEVEVLDSLGNKRKAWMYLQDPEKLGGTFIKQEPMKRITAAARDNHLPEQWIKFLESFIQN